MATPRGGSPCGQEKQSLGALSSCVLSVKDFPGSQFSAQEEPKCAGWTHALPE